MKKKVQAAALSLSLLLVPLSACNPPDSAVAKDTGGQESKFQPTEARVILDGRALNFDQPPVLTDTGVTLVPLRGIFEPLGATVNWEEDKQKVTARKGATTIELTVGSTTAYKNSLPLTLAEPAALVGDRTLVPLRFVSEALGAVVEWKADTQEIVITSGAPNGISGGAASGQAPAVTPVTITRVIDGDTVEATVGGVNETIRLIGVDAPEAAPVDKAAPYGKEAAEFTKKQLTGKTLWLEKDQEERDDSGKLWAYLWLEEPKARTEEEARKKMFNARLLLDGYAKNAKTLPNVAYDELLGKIAQEAWKAKKGIWGAGNAPPKGG